MYTSMVVALDLENVGDQALPVAASLGRAGGLDVELVTVSSPHMPSDPDIFELDQRVAAHHIERHSSTVLHGDEVGPVLVEHVASRPDALLVMGTSARGPLSALFLGSVTEYVLGHLHRPVLLVGPHASGADLAEPALLVSVGETDRTGVTVPAVRSWVETFATSQVWAVHVREGPITPPQVQTEQRAADNVHRLTSELVRHGVPAQHRTILDGAPIDGLEQFATQTAGAVLLAVSARWTEPDHRHRHSVAREIARRSTRPVLVVPANDVEASSGGTGEPASTRQTGPDDPVGAHEVDARH